MGIEFFDNRSERGNTKLPRGDNQRCLSLKVGAAAVETSSSKQSSLTPASRFRGSVAINFGPQDFGV